MKNRVIFVVNAIYSRLWIAAHSSNKFEYRENSNVHEWLMSKVAF